MKGTVEFLSSAFSGAGKGDDDSGVEKLREEIALSDDIRSIYHFMKRVVLHLVGNKQFTTASLTKLSRYVWAIIPEGSTKSDRGKVLNYCSRLINTVCVLTSSKLAAQRVSALTILGNIPYSLNTMKELDSSLELINETLEDCSYDKSIVVRRGAKLIKRSLDKLDISKECIGESNDNNNSSSSSRENTHLCDEMIKIMFKNRSELQFLGSLIKKKDHTKTTNEGSDGDDNNCVEIIDIIKNLRVKDVTLDMIRKMWKYTKKMFGEMFFSEEEKIPELNTFLSFIEEYFKVEEEYYTKTKVITYLYKICALITQELSRTSLIDEYYSHITTAIRYILERKPSDYSKAISMIKMIREFGRFIVSIYRHFSTQIQSNIVEPLISVLRNNDPVLTSEKLASLALFSILFNTKYLVVSEARASARRHCLRILNESTKTPDAIMKRAVGSSVAKSHTAPLHLCCSSMCMIALSPDSPSMIKVLRTVADCVLDAVACEELNGIPGYNDVLRICPYMSILVLHQYADMLTVFKREQSKNNFENDNNNNDDGSTPENLEKEENESENDLNKLYDGIADVFQKIYSFICRTIEDLKVMHYENLYASINSASLAILISLLLNNKNEENERMTKEETQLYGTILFVQTLISRMSLWSDSHVAREVAMKVSIVRSVLTKKLWRDVRAFGVGCVAAYLWGYNSDIAIDDSSTGVGDGEGWGLTVLACHIKAGVRIDKMTTLRLLTMPYPDTPMVAWAKRTLVEHVSTQGGKCLLCKESLKVMESWDEYTAKNNDENMNEEGTENEKIVAFKLEEDTVSDEHIRFTLKLCKMVKLLYDNVTSGDDDQERNEDSDYQDSDG